MVKDVEVASNKSESPADDNDESKPYAIPDEGDEEEDEGKTKRASGKGKSKKDAEESGSEDEEEEPEEYEVEKILKSRPAKGGKKEYFVHWKGFPSSEDTWEPEANLQEGCEDLLEAFKEKEKTQASRRGRTKGTPAKSTPQKTSSRKKGSVKYKDDSDDSDREDEKKDASKKRRYEETDDEETDDDFAPARSKKTKAGGKKSEVAQDTPKRSSNGGMKPAIARRMQNGLSFLDDSDDSDSDTESKKDKKEKEEKPTSSAKTAEKDRKSKAAKEADEKEHSVEKELEKPAKGKKEDGKAKEMKEPVKKARHSAVNGVGGSGKNKLNVSGLYRDHKDEQLKVVADGHVYEIEEALEEDPVSVARFFIGRAAFSSSGKVVVEFDEDD